MEDIKEVDIIFQEDDNGDVQVDCCKCSACIEVKDHPDSLSVFIALVSSHWLMCPLGDSADFYCSDCARAKEDAERKSSLMHEYDCMHDSEE